MKFHWASLVITSVLLVNAPLVFADSVTDTITVGDFPLDIAFDSTNNRMYVTNQNDDTVSVISTATNTVIATITVGDRPNGIAFDPDNDRMYVANFGDNDVDVISTATNTVITAITVGTGPTGIAFDSENDRMYVVNTNGSSVSVISTATNTVISTIGVTSNGSEFIAFDSTNNRMYVPNNSQDEIYVISTATNTFTDTIAADNARYIAFDPDNDRMYVSNQGGTTVHVISTATNTIVNTITVNGFAGGMAYNTQNNRMYVTDDFVSSIDTSSNGVTQITSTSTGSLTIAYDSANNRMYVVDNSEDRVYVIHVSSNGSSNPFTSGGFAAPTIGLDKNGVRIIDDGFSYNGNAVDVVDFHTPFPLISAQVGQTNDVTVKVSDDASSAGLRLIQFGLGVPEIGSPLNYAETIIEIWFEYGSSEIQEVKIIDKENLIEDSSVDISTKLVGCRDGSSDQCTAISMKHMYREAPIYNIIRVEVMDGFRNVQSSTFNDGVEVLGESMNPADTMKTHVPGMFYPQKLGLVEITQIDRAQKLWTDPYGYIWQGDDSKIKLVSEIPVNLQDDDPKSVFSGYSDRINSNFVSYKQEQIDKATALFDSSLIQNDENYIAKTTSFGIRDDSALKQSLIDEAIKAQLVLEELLSKTHNVNMEED